VPREFHKKYQSQDAPTLLACFIIVPEMLLNSHTDQIKRKKKERDSCWLRYI